MSFFNVFTRDSRSGDAWFSAGPSTSYPNITASGSTPLSAQLPCQERVALSCKVFYVPSDDSSQAKEIDQSSSEGLPADLKDQVVVFRYQGDFHAVDHVSIYALGSVEVMVDVVLELSSLVVSTFKRYSLRYRRFWRSVERGHPMSET